MLGVMKYQDVIDYYGSLDQACELLDVTRGTLWNWRLGIPWVTQCRIQVETGGRLTANRDDIQMQLVHAKTRAAKRHR